MRRFIIATNGANTERGVTAVHRDLITGYLQGKGWHVWHWFEDLWLVATPEPIPQFSIMLDEIVELIGDKSLFFQWVSETDFAFWISSTTPSIPWLKRHWTPEHRKLELLSGHENSASETS